MNKRTSKLELVVPSYAETLITARGPYWRDPETGDCFDCIETKDRRLTVGQPIKQPTIFDDPPPKPFAWEANG